MLPKTVNIMGQTYRVKIKKHPKLDDGTMLCGFIDHLNRKIVIKKDMHPDVQKTTLIHEMLHGITYIGGHGNGDSMSEETMVECISQNLERLIADNPKLFKRK